MSATNRGGKRRASDFYETPENVARFFIEFMLTEDYKTILEPCSGSGNIVRALREFYPKATIIASDILDVDQIKQANVTYPNTDFLVEPALDTPIDLIITNPPYSIAEKIIRRCFDLYPTATVVMLLRLDFLGSQERHDFWSKHPVNQIYPLSCRPSFTGDGGTDSNNYGWFVWEPGNTKQNIEVIWGR
ncbi:MAG: hypothetical protein QM401_00805 [Bacillota bacterium]|nr:hypothetical protein [Bacillota bacterium]